MTTPDPSQNLLPPTYLGGPQIGRDNCEREPIHIPGAIQPHGALLVLDARTLEVLQASENIGGFLPETFPSTLLGQRIPDLLPGLDLNALLQALPDTAPDSLQYRALHEPYALTAHRVSERIILEIERAPQSLLPFESQELRNAVFEMDDAQSVQELAEVVVRAVRGITGFDRVMLYRFEPDDSGFVVAEARRDDLSGFLGHRFPASDIPPQARHLYVRHLLRLTADVQAEAVPLLPRLDPVNGQPTPLGGAVLRATSPVHVQYLKNMGVGSSLSVSIVVDGRLWGLIACHHEGPLVVPPDTRNSMEYLGRLAGLQIRVKHRLEADRFRQRLTAQQVALMQVAARTTNPRDDLAAQESDLLSLMSASGAVLAFEGEWRGVGVLPPTEAIETLLAWLRHQPEGQTGNGQTGSIWHSDHLQSVLPELAPYAQTMSGVLAIGVGRGWQEAVIWLRPEVQLEALWGGATPENAKGELGPRTSFETYRELQSGHSQPWHTGELEEAEQLGRSLTVTLGERLLALRELNEALAESEAQWRKLAVVASHDLQEPVRQLHQLATLIQARYRASGDPQLLDHLRDASSALRDLVRQVQEYAHALSLPRHKRPDVDFDNLTHITTQPSTSAQSPTPAQPPTSAKSPTE